MKEFIEKLIGRLEEASNNVSDLEDYSCDNWYGGRVSGFLNSIEIVNQLAEEYKDNIEFSQKCVELAEKMNLCDLVAENVRLSHKIRFLELETKKNNNGWIPCKNELPKETGYYIVTYKKNGNLLVGYWLFNGIDFNQTEEVKVLYWQPLPAPYNPKGE